MRILVIGWLLLWIGSSRAEPPLTALQHIQRGYRWQTATRYEKAIEEFEQAYLLEERPLCLYYMATSYDRLANLATKSASEALESKQRAVELYTAFVEKAPPDEPGLDVARGRIEALRQEIKDLTAQAAERDATLKAMNDKLDLLIKEVRALREQLPRRDRGATPAGFMR
jgi:tetratricopeptide (TPR) repeat protein